MPKPSYKTNDPKGWMGDPRRGAALGRPNFEPKDFDRNSFTGKMALQRIRLDSGGYDRNGTYWGDGAPLYWAASEDGEIEMTFRAIDRDQAKKMVLERYPNARFYK